MDNIVHNITSKKKEIIIFAFAVVGAVILGFLDTALPWYLAVAGLLGSIIFIFTLRQPMWGLLLLIFFLPFERLGALEAGGLTIRISQIMLIVTAAAWCIRLLWRSEYPRVHNPLLIPLALFLLVNILSLVNSPNLSRSVIVLAFTLFTAFLTFLVPMLVTDRAKADKAITVLIVSFVIVSAFGLFQFGGDMMGLPTSLTGLRDLYTKGVLGFTRVQSTAYEPLYFANFLLIPLTFLLALFLSGRNTIKNGWLIILFGLGMINLVLTASRGGYLAAAAALFVVVIFYLRKVLTVRNMVIFAAAIVVVGWVVVRSLGAGGGLFTIEKFQEHIGNAFYGASYNERVETFDQAITAWHEHPWLGVGVGGFGPSVAPQPDYMPKDGWKIVNNEFLELLAETGILGAFFFGLFVIVLLVRSLKAIAVTKDTYLRALLVGSLAAFVGILVQYQTFSTLYVMHVWFLIGFMVALQNIVLSRVEASR
jgi:O-antigen ligase